MRPLTGTAPPKPPARRRCLKHPSDNAAGSVGPHAPSSAFHGVTDPSTKKVLAFSWALASSGTWDTLRVRRFEYRLVLQDTSQLVLFHFSFSLPTGISRSPNCGRANAPTRNCPPVPSSYLLAAITIFLAAASAAPQCGLGKDLSMRAVI